jgi:hypothetical protein
VSSCTGDGVLSLLAAGDVDLRAACVTTTSGMSEDTLDLRDSAVIPSSGSSVGGGSGESPLPMMPSSSRYDAERRLLLRLETAEEATAPDPDLAPGLPPGAAPRGATPISDPTPDSPHCMSEDS